MLQVGYGDIAPVTALEEMTAVFLMLIGGDYYRWLMARSLCQCFGAWNSAPEATILAAEFQVCSRSLISLVSTGWKQAELPDALADTRDHLAGIIFFGFVISSSQ